MQMRPAGKSETYVALSAAGMVGLTVKAESGSVRLGADDKSAGIDVGVRGESAALRATDTGSTVTLSSPHDHFFNVETGADHVRMHGMANPPFTMGDPAK